MGRLEHEENSLYSKALSRCHAIFSYFYWANKYARNYVFIYISFLPLRLILLYMYTCNISIIVQRAMNSSNMYNKFYLFSFQEIRISTRFTICYWCSIVIVFLGLILPFSELISSPKKSHLASKGYVET